MLSCLSLTNQRWESEGLYGSTASCPSQSRGWHLQRVPGGKNCPVKDFSSPPRSAQTQHVPAHQRLCFTLLTLSSPTGVLQKPTIARSVAPGASQLPRRPLGPQRPPPKFPAAAAPEAPPASGRADSRFAAPGASCQRPPSLFLAGPALPRPGAAEGPRRCRCSPGRDPRNWGTRLPALLPVQGGGGVRPL